MKETPHDVQSKGKVIQLGHEQADDDIADQRQTEASTDAEAGTSRIHSTVADATDLRDPGPYELADMVVRNEIIGSRAF